MRCPKCDAESSVIETRKVAGNMLRRRRVCDNTACGSKFSTIESIVETSARHDDAVVIVLPRKAARGLQKALAILDGRLKSDQLDDVPSSNEQGDEQPSKEREPT